MARTRRAPKRGGPKGPRGRPGGGAGRGRKKPATNPDEEIRMSSDDEVPQQQSLSSVPLVPDPTPHNAPNSELPTSSNPPSPQEPHDVSMDEPRAAQQEDDQPLEDARSPSPEPQGSDDDLASATPQEPQQHSAPQVITPQPKHQGKNKEYVMLRASGGRVRKVADTKENRALAVRESLEPRPQTLKNEQDIKFAGISPEIRELPEGDLIDDTTMNAIHQITLGTAFMDVRALKTQWTDSTGFTQRSYDPAHISKLVESFAVRITRVRPEHRLYVSMAREDFDKSVAFNVTYAPKEQQSQLQLKIQDTAAAALYNVPGEVPALLPANRPGTGFDKYDPVECRVEAGQHRVMALIDRTKKHHPEKMSLHKRGLLDPDEAVRQDVRLHFGWTVVILDAAETIKPENRKIMNRIRLNRKDVYKEDCEGVVIATAIKTWNELSQEERNKYSIHFDLFIKDYLSTLKTVGHRIKRIFLTPTICGTVEMFVARQWGSDLFQESRWTALINARSAKLVEKVCKEAALALGSFIEIGDNYDENKTYPQTNAVQLVTLRDIEAIASCFRSSNGTLSLEAWQQLFFPTHDDKSKATFDMLKKISNYKTEVYIEENCLDVTRRGERLHRDFRRPEFLTFLNDENYQDLFVIHFKKGKGYRLIQYPSDHDNYAKAAFFPTAKWFCDFCTVDMAKFKAVFRLHWFCCCPESYSDILALAPNTKGATRQMAYDFDMVNEMEEAYMNYRELDFKKQHSDDTFTAPENEIENPKAYDYSQLKFDDERLGHKNFREYVWELLEEVQKIRKSEKDFEEACDIPRELITDADRHETPVLKFYEQILKNKFIHKSFQILIEKLGSPFLKGVGTLFVEDYIGAPSGNPTLGTDFFSMQIPRPLSAHRATEVCVEAMPMIKQLYKSAKKDIIETLEPYIDVIANSILIGKLTRDCRSWDLRKKQCDTHDLKQDDAARFDKEWAVHSANDRAEAMTTIQDILDRFRVNYNYTTLPSDASAWVNMNGPERQAVLPHVVTTHLDTMLFLENNEGRRPSPSSENETVLPAEKWIREFIRSDVRNSLPYDASQARIHYAKVDTERERQKTKGTKRKAKSTEYVNDTDTDDDAQLATPHNSKKRKSTSAATKKKPATAPKPRPRAGRRRQTSASHARPVRATTASTRRGKNASSNRKRLPSHSPTPLTTDDEPHLSDIPDNSNDDADDKSQQSEEGSDGGSDNGSNDDSQHSDSGDNSDSDGNGPTAGDGPVTETDENPDTRSDHEDQDDDDDDSDENTPLPSFDKLDWTLEGGLLPEATEAIVAEKLHIAERNLNSWDAAQKMTSAEKGPHTKKCKAARVKLVARHIKRWCPNWDTNDHDEIPSNVLRYLPRKEYFKYIDEGNDYWDRQLGLHAGIQGNTPDRGKKRGGAKNSGTDGKSQAPARKRAKSRADHLVE